MSVKKCVHYNFPFFSRFLKSLNSFKFCHFLSQLKLWVHTYVHTVVSNCLIYCPGCILRNHLRSGPAWADGFYGPPNEIWVLFSSGAIRWNTFFPRELWSSFVCCSGIFLLMELPSLQTANWGECSSLALLQHALAESLPPGPAWQHQCCLRLPFHTPGFFFPRLCFTPIPCPFLCSARGGSWPGAMLGIIKVMFTHLHFFRGNTNWWQSFGRSNTTYPVLLSSRMLFCNYPPVPKAGCDAHCSRVLAWGLFSFIHLNKFTLLTNTGSLFALKKQVCTTPVQAECSHVN